MLAKKRFQCWRLKLENIVKTCLKLAMEKKYVKKPLSDLINGFEQVFPI